MTRYETSFERRKVVETLISISEERGSSDDLRSSAFALDSLSLTYSSVAAANAYSALAGLLRILDSLVQWRTAVLEALSESDRFLRSAKERYSLWQAEFENKSEASALQNAASSIPVITSISDVASIARAIVSVPLPVGIHISEGSKWAGRIPHPERNSAAENEKRTVPVDLTVAFLKFHIDGQPASEVDHLSPMEVHDLEIEVRVSRWPFDHGELRLTPISVEPKSTYDFPVFSFRKPSGDPPYVMSERGRAVVLLPQGMNARPFEFKYSAEFLPEQGEQPVATVGHRTLLIEGTDVSKYQICGYETLDRKLFQIRDTLRRRPGIPQQETTDLLQILAPLCNLAGRAVQDALFPGNWLEKDFQIEVLAELRRHPLIGSKLDEHAFAAGGITDLTLHGLPIELKVRNELTTIADCEHFFAQAASYAVAKEKKTAVLCVLDTSRKESSPRAADSLLDVRFHEGSGVTLCVLVIQGNLARPSSLSR